MSDEEPLKVALLGCGVVGSHVARLLLENAAEFTARIGRPLELIGIGVRRTGVERPGIDPALLTTDLDALVGPDVDLVIEVMGGIEPARTLINAAIANGVSVVTANKALLASEPAIFKAADAAGVDLYYEAAVAGAIPIIRPLRESLVGDEVTAVSGIVNGTTNFILDKMHTEGWSFDEALAEAQRLGFAEADPTADVEGFDAAAKAAILASLAFHTRVTIDDVDREGITGVTADDVATATELGYVIKLIAKASLAGNGIAVGVHPTLVPVKHPLASVSDAFNAIFIESRNAGQLMFMGPGAGGSPTASAVLGDVVTAARNVVRGVAGPGESTHSARRIAGAARTSSRFYLSLLVADEPGVLARIAQAFAQHKVSIQAVRQTTDETEEAPDGGGARLAIMTHTARVADLDAAVVELRGLDFVNSVTVMRVEGN